MIRGMAKVGRPMITTMDRMTNSGELVISKQKVRSNKDRKTKDHKLWYLDKVWRTKDRQAEGMKQQE